MTRRIVPCVGWKGDAPCPVFGPLHGCKHPDGHSTPKWHECDCGDKAKAWIQRAGRCQANYIIGIDLRRPA